MIITMIRKILIVGLIISLLNTNLLLAEAVTSSDTLATQSMSNAIVSISRENGKIIITEDKEAVKELEEGFKKDVQTVYFNLLKAKAKEIGLSQKWLKREIAKSFGENKYRKNSLVRKKQYVL